MNATLIHGAAGSGKTQAALHVIRDNLAEDPFRTIWVLQPGEMQAAAFRARLLEALGETSFGVTVMDFYALYRRLLRRLGDPPRGLRDTAQIRVLRQLIAELAPDLRFYRAVAAMPGFVRVAASFIQELKRAHITPDAFLNAVRTAGRLADRDQDLALIYRTYQDFLRENALVDSEGEGWLALAELDAQPDYLLGVDLLVVDGFDQFTVVQADLLVQLSRRISHTILTLTYEEAREQTAHRRSAQALLRLQASGLRLEQNPLQPFAAKRRPVALNALSTAIFEHHVEPVPTDGAIRFIEAPDLRREAEEALRHIKHDLLSGIAPERIALTARDLNAYAGHLNELAHAYGIPLWLRAEFPLLSNPAVLAAISLIDAAASRFARRALLDLLHNPYLHCPYLTAEQIAILDRLAREQLILAGEESWLRAIDRAERRSAASDAVAEPEPDPAEAPSERYAPLRLDAAKAAALRAGLMALFERLRPPRLASAEGYIAWVEALIGPDPLAVGEADESDAVDDDLSSDGDAVGDLQPHFDLIGSIRAGMNAPDPLAARIGARDLSAIATFLDALRDLGAGYALLSRAGKEPASTGDPVAISWEAFRAELTTVVQTARTSPPQPIRRGARVLACSVYEIRGLPHDHLYVLGLAEGQFPAPAREDAFYHDSERVRLRDAGLHDLVTRAEEADESSLFYELTALAQVRLTFLRPYADKGAPWPPSPYWNQARQIAPDAPLDHVRITDRAAPDRAASALELFTGLAQPPHHTGSANQQTAAVIAWVTAQPEYGVRWAHAQAAIEAEMRRRTGQRSSYNGTLTNPRLLQILGERLGPPYLWSASQLNTLGTSPFQFFARRILDLEPLPEPEAGLDARQRGSVVHAILEQVYRTLSAERLTIIPANTSIALERLTQAAPSVLAEAPQRFGFVPDALWEQEQRAILSELWACITADFNGAPVAKVSTAERVPVAFEQPFGPGQGDLLLQTSAGNLRIRGRIDRIDETPDGRAIVLDYKSGTTPITPDALRTARNVQMLLYSEAASGLLRDTGAAVAGGVFLSIRDGRALGTIRTDTDREVLEEARARIGALVSAARHGSFPEAPDRPERELCSQYCEYAALCRVAVAGRRG